MSVRSAQSITAVFTTRRFDTGAATNGDSTPTGTLYVNGTADAATVTVTNITTGVYKAAVTLPTLAVGDVVDLRISATVNSVTDNAVVWRDTKDIVIDSAGLADANAVKLGPSGSGTAQTARDIGASVLLSSGTGTGQLKLASGYVAMTWADIAAPTTAVNLSGTTVATTQKVDVETIKTQSVTCAAGVTVSPFVGSTGAAVNGTNANTLSSHDPGATLGTSTLTQAQVTGGAYALNSSSFAFNAALDFTTTQKTSIGTAVAASAVASVTGNVGGNVTGTVGGFTTSAKAEIQAEAEDALAAVGVTTTVTGRIDAAISTRLASASYTAPLDAAGVRDAVGLANANLDTQFGAIDDYLDTEVAAIKAKTDNLPSDPADASDVAAAFSAVNSTLATIAAYVDTEVAAIKSDTAAILDDTGTSGVVVASGSKSGYALSSAGLDAVSTTAPSGVASNFREMLVQVWRRFFKKSTLTSTELKTYADDGSTVVTTQTVSDDGTTQAQGGAS